MVKTRVQVQLECLYIGLNEYLEKISRRFALHVRIEKTMIG
jgi:hypothetical protein